ncbi:nucleolar protein 9 isoform X2 [Gopherus flavomarginatus]|uniref:nucleolar protein 9 isoform X2 n=1 Tax=Gopherus flavomarginatus TaxID=286002 RepID=UPI0021CBE654|nr:nucleolar protein 9 isoform X2 [Gopherus flavomarginatus]
MSLFSEIFYYTHNVTGVHGAVRLSLCSPLQVCVSPIRWGWWEDNGGQEVARECTVQYVSLCSPPRSVRHQCVGGGGGLRAAPGPGPFRLPAAPGPAARGLVRPAGQAPAPPAARPVPGCLPPLWCPCSGGCPAPGSPVAGRGGCWDTGGAGAAAGAGHEGGAEGLRLGPPRQFRGPPAPRKKRAEAKSEGPVEFEVPDSFLALLREFIAAFQENIAEFITHRVASLCLQVALEVLHRKLPEACAELCRSVIGYLSSRNPAAGCSPLLVFLKDAVCSRVLDKVLEVSEPRALRLLYRQHFRGQLRALAGHGVANFTLQRLLGAAPPKLLGKVLAELGPGLEEVLAQGHAGVATALLGACRRCGAGQKEALQLLMEAFHCWEPPARRAACAPLFASLLPYEVYYAPGKGQEAQPPLEEQPDSPPALASISLHGSLLLQHLLHFADPSPVLRSLAALPPHDLVTLACSPAGSHVYDALLASPSVPRKPRRKVLCGLQGHYVSLACNKHGSRVLDAIWSRATLPAKRQIAQELAEQEQQLRNDPFGHHVVRNFALTHFLKRRRDWDRHQEAETKRRELFAEILED